jgi:hypothetical protein
VGFSDQALIGVELAVSLRLPKAKSQKPTASCQEPVSHLSKNLKFTPQGWHTLANGIWKFNCELGHPRGSE